MKPSQKEKSQEEAVASLKRIIRNRNSVKLRVANETAKVKDRLILNPVYKKMLINLPKKELTISNINRLFAYTTKKGSFDVREPIINTKAVCTLAPGEFTNVKEVETTAGSILFNKLFIEGKLDHVIDNGYVNDVMTNKKFNGIMNKLGVNYREGKVTLEQLVEFLKDFEFYSLSLSTIFSPSFTHGILRPHPEVIKLRDKLLKELPENPSLADIVKIEDTLTAKAKELAKGDPGMTLYDSGSRGSFDNDYKSLSIMVGAAIDPATNHPNLIPTNFIDGIRKDDIPAMGTAVVAASYPKAVGTQVTGYLTKQFYAVYQAITTDDDETDCGTTQGLVRVLTEDNYKTYMYQNVMLANGGHVPITEENKNKLLNKKVIIRSPMFCKNDEICSVCAGRTPYDFDMKNIGLNAGSISNSLMNKRMKLFHETKVKFNKVDIDNLII